MTEPVLGTPDELVDEIEKIRERLSDNIDELITRSKPKNIAARQLEKVRAHFIDEYGNPRFENIMPPAAITAASIAGIVILRRLLK